MIFYIRKYFLNKQNKDNMQKELKSTEVKTNQKGMVQMGYYDTPNNPHESTNQTKKENTFNISNSEKVFVAQDKSQIISANNFLQSFIYTSGQKPVTRKLLALIILEYIVLIVIPYFRLASTIVSSESEIVQLLNRFGFYFMTFLMITLLTFRLGVQIYSIWTSWTWGFLFFYLLQAIGLHDILVFPISLAAFIGSLHIHFSVFGLRKIVNVTSDVPHNHNQTYKG
jgi:hypothetical protein